MKSFSVKKTIQVLGYLQKKTNSTDKIKLLKLCFFADRKMIRTFGIPILFDEYYALKLGPVCSQTKDILQQDFDYLYVTKEDENLIKDFIEYNGAHDMKIKDLGESSLSKADKIALDFVIEKFAKFSPFDLVEITHDYPEWKKWEKKLSEKNKSHPMNYLDFFNNPSEKKAINKYFDSKDPYEDTVENLEIAKSMYMQNYENRC